MIYNFDYVVNHKELRNFLKQSINLLKENKTYENNSMLIVNSFRFCPNLFRLNASLNKMSKTIDLKDLNTIYVQLGT